MAKNHSEPTLSELFDELQIIIEEFENNYEQTLKELKKKLEVEKNGRNNRGR